MLLRSLLILVLLALPACISHEDVFSKHVHDRRDEIKDLKSGRVSCMHCPSYFRFEASKEVTAKLIAKHRLEQVNELPTSLKSLVTLSIKEEWWLAEGDLPKMTIYLREYDPKPGQGGERRLRLALVNGSTVYWVTNGYMDTEDQNRTK
jgi:hypothetical protein